MSFIRYQVFGKKEYAYEITAYWDKKLKKPRQKSRYLGGVIDKGKKLFEKKSIATKPEKLIVDFGDSYVLHQVLEETGFNQMLQKSFPKMSDELLALIHYRLCYGGAMMYADRWFESSYSRLQFKTADLSSQRISDMLDQLGEERQQRLFFDQYMPTFSGSKQGIIIDATSLPNQIHMPMTEWGRSGEEIDKQVRFLMVVDKQTSAPMYFRTLPGNIIDVSTLCNTIEELKKYGVKDTYVYSDAGFFSEENILEMYQNNINFLTRLPATRTIYKDLIHTEVPGIESGEYAVRYGKRGLLVKKKEIELFGRKAFAYIIQDPKRKGREMDRLLVENIDEKDKNKETFEYDILRRGIMILVSSFDIPRADVVPTYYVRQTVEMLFGFSKDDLGILPLRVHSEQRMQGFLLLQFLCLIAFTRMRNKLGTEYTVEEALLSLRNLKAKVFDSGLVVGELTREQKEITKKLGVLMTKNPGI